jgi:transposase
MRRGLDVLALVAPAWLLQHTAPEWEERYAGEFVRRLPKTEPARERLATTIGQDGMSLLAAFDAPTSPVFPRQVEAIVTLRQVWTQQYEQGDDGPHFRLTEQLASAATLTVSRYDPDARFTARRQTSWTGYMVHLTETCEPNLPCLVVGVETTPATTPDAAVLAPNHADLATRSLLPGTQLVDEATAPPRRSSPARRPMASCWLGPCNPTPPGRHEPGRGSISPTLNWTGTTRLRPVRKARPVAPGGRR